MRDAKLDGEKPPSGAASEPRLGRRAVVTAGLGGVVASALTQLRVAHAQDDVEPGAPLLLGQENFAGATTGLVNEGDGPALRVDGLGAGVGVQVMSKELPAVQARSGGVGLLGGGGLPANAPFTEVTSLPPTGVAGVSGRVGVLGVASPVTLTTPLPGSGPVRVGVPVGVWGSGGALGNSVVITATRELRLPGVGVWGSAPVLPGAPTFTMTVGASGVVGTAFGAKQTAVLAHNPRGTALQVDGGIAVTCGGKGVIPRLSREVEVSDPSIKANSTVVVTLMGDPGNQSSLQHVEVEEGRMRIALTGRPRLDLPFSFVCFELAARRVTTTRIRALRG